MALVLSSPSIYWFFLVRSLPHIITYQMFIFLCVHFVIFYRARIASALYRILLHSLYLFFFFVQPLFSSRWRFADDSLHMCIRCALALRREFVRARKYIFLRRSNKRVCAFGTSFIYIHMNVSQTNAFIHELTTCMHHTDT